MNVRVVRLYRIWSGVYDARIISGRSPSSLRAASSLFGLFGSSLYVRMKLRPMTSRSVGKHKLLLIMSGNVLTGIGVAFSAGTLGSDVLCLNCNQSFTALKLAFVLRLRLSGRLRNIRNLSTSQLRRFPVHHFQR